MQTITANIYWYDRLSLFLFIQEAYGFNTEFHWNYTVCLFLLHYTQSSVSYHICVITFC